MKVDFVLLWVDGNDPEWQKEFNKWSKKEEGDKSVKRYRDWNNLKYLFRAFEFFTPWVRKIHFVTWGHLPKWLNINHPKINIVNHQDILDKSKLPVFSSHPLEINLHKIKNLSERFVYFNDDTFILKPLSKERFFRKGLPCDMLVFNTIFLDSISHIRLNNIEIISKYFNKKRILKKLFFKIFNLKYSYHQIRSLLLLPWPQFTGFYDPHQPQPFLKQTFLEVWEKEEEYLNKVSSHKFRTKDDVNQYLFRYWQMLKGNFYPISFSDTYTIPVKSKADVDKAVQIIIKQKFNMLCINDEIDDIDSNTFNSFTTEINNAFEKILPKKSGFEI